MKTQTQHTPGPWSYQLGHTVFEVSTADRNICDINLPGSVDDEDEANARLIAAAPELLEALKEMLEVDEAICTNTGRKSDQAMQRIAAIDMARAAISKATGEKP